MIDLSAGSAPTDLLTKMAVGATRPLFTVDEWVVWFADTGGAGAFIDELRDEWLPAEPPDAICVEVEERCRAQIAAWHTGWPHLWAHIRRVAGYALWLAPEVGLARDQAYVLAMVHDVGKLEEFRTGEKHEKFGARYAQEVLAGHYDQVVISAIADAITKQGNLTSLHRRILHDADKLDKIGATGILRRVSLHREAVNALSGLHEVAASLRTFPPMYLLSAETMAVRKRSFTAQFLKEYIEAA